MMRISAGQLVRTAFGPVTVLALAASLTACQGNQPSLTAASAPASGTPPSGTGPSTASADPVSTSDTATAAGQPAGSLSISVSSPTTVTGGTPTSVDCRIGRTYRATASRATIRGNELSFTVAIADYRGPGSYPAVVAVTWHQASGLVTTLAGVSRVPAVITSTGGSFTVSAIGREGRTFTGSVRWVCGS